jgi:hypothetical protein
MTINKSFLTARGVHVDKPLTNLTIAYLQSTTAFIADKVFPNVPVSHQSDKYYKYDRESFNKRVDTKRAERTRSRRVGMTLSTDSYFAEVYSLNTDFSFRELANEDTALDIRSGGSAMLTQRMLIDREVRFAETFFSSGIWATEIDGVASNPQAGEVIKWSDYLASTPIKDVTDAHQAFLLKSGGIKANTMILGKRVRDVLVNHPDFLSRVNGGATTTNPAEVTDRFIASMFGVQNLYIMEAVVDNAADGLPEDLSFIGGDHALLLYVAPAPGLMQPSAGYTFTWNELDNASGLGVEVRSFSGDWLAVDDIAEMIEVQLAYDQKVTGADLGYFFNEVI